MLRDAVGADPSVRRRPPLTVEEANASPPMIHTKADGDKSWSFAVSDLRETVRTELFVNPCSLGSSAASKLLVSPIFRSKIGGAGR